MGVLDRELPELRAAPRHAVDTGDIDTGLRLAAALTFYAYLRMRDEILRWAEQMVTLPTACEHPLYAAVCGTAAFGCIHRGGARARPDLRPARTGGRSRRLRRLTDEDASRVLLMAKGSLFLERMSQSSDGMSVVLERNPA